MTLFVLGIFLSYQDIDMLQQMGGFEQAMETFPMGGNSKSSFDDIDTSTYSVRAAESDLGI